MTQEKQVVDGEFEEVQAEAAQEEGVKTQAELVIRLYNNGQLDVSVPDGKPELQPADIEGLTRQVYEQLRDMRIANQAIEGLKQRLG